MSTALTPPAAGAAVGVPGAAPSPGGALRAAAARRRLPLGRWLVLAVAAVYFFGPLAAAFWFSVDSRTTGVSLGVYGRMFGAPGFGHAFGLSLEMSVITVVATLALLVPMMLVVHLRHPRWRPVVEVLCLLPLVVPPVVLVVGVRGVLGWGPDEFAGTPVAAVLSALQSGGLPWILPLEYVVLALPFTYRAVDAGLRAGDLATLVEASRGLGASWPATVGRVVLPSLRTALLSASFLAFALVLGEFTVASILQYQTFSVWILQFNNSDGQLSVAVSLLSLVLTWVLLLLLALAGRQRTTKGARA